MNKWYIYAWASESLWMSLASGYGRQFADAVKPIAMDEFNFR